MSNKESFESITLDVEKPEEDKEDKYTGDEDLDRSLSTQKKRQEIFIQKLDGFLKFIVHPFCLICIGMLFVVMYLIVKYVALYYQESLFLQAFYQDLNNAIGYIATALISSIVTEFIHSLREPKKDKND